MTATSRHHTEIDLVVLELIRLVTTDSWTPPRTAVKLRQRVPDEQVLRATRAHVLPALLARPSTVAQRVVATLDTALAVAAE